MLARPSRAKARHTFLLTADGLELVRHDDLGVVFRQPLAPGVLGPRSSSELSGYALLDPVALREAVRACMQQAGRPFRRAQLALDGLLIRQVHLPLPYLPPEEELRTAVQSETERYMVFAGTEVAFDYALLEQEPGALSLMVAAGRKDYISELLAVFQDEGVTITGLEPMPFALVRSLDEEWLTQETPCGLITLLPHQLQISAWSHGKLVQWRTLYLDAEAMRREDVLVLGEARVELQRSLMDAPPERWILVDAPEALEEVLELHGGMTVRRHAVRTSGGYEDVTRAASRRTAEAFPFGFDLLAERKAERQGPSKAKVGMVAVAIALLVLALGTNLFLSQRQQAILAQLEQLQADTERLQTEIQAPDRRAEAEQTRQEALRRTQGVGRLFRGIQEATPHDVWLESTRLDDEGTLKVEGYALSRTSPLAFAKSLGHARDLAKIEVPEVAEAERQGTRVYRFRLEAAFRPQEEAPL